MLLRREIALAFGAVLASFALTLGLTHRGPTRARAEARVRPPLGFAATSARCESCHPRQTAEWRRSVLAHSARSPLFEALELLIEEQVGRSAACPEGAGVLRRRDPDHDCRAANGVVESGAGGEGWCVNCHAPGQNLAGRVPSWSANAPGPENRSLSELLEPAAMDGIGCTFCHQVDGPGHANAARVNGDPGNPTWVSPLSGATFFARATEYERRFGIANSGYRLDPAVLLAADTERLVPGGAHRASEPAVAAYLASSEFCGTCHDVRLFGTDVLGQARGEHFKRLRNAYSEWRDYAVGLRAQGRDAPSCQACHLSNYPGVCVADMPGAEPATPRDEAVTGGCPAGTRFEAREPGTLTLGFASAALGTERPLHAHDFGGVEVPLTADFERALADERVLSAAGRPLGVRARRDLLLRASVHLSLSTPERVGGSWQIPVTVENVGAGHRVPAGFSQERELWLELRVTDERGRALYEVGKLARADEDLRDKRFLSVTTEATEFDALGRPLGLFGADVVDGPDVPRWEPPPELGGARFRGRGLVNFQNGFLRCVRCIGRIDAAGTCTPLSDPEEPRAARFADGDYDLDTGTCVSNLAGRAALFETFFPVGALDATRGVLKAPDAIIDTRSLPPSAPVTYVYDLALAAPRVHVSARLLFRAFPPYLIRAFAAYEAAMNAAGRRANGPLVTAAALERLEIVELARAEANGS